MENELTPGSPQAQYEVKRIAEIIDAALDEWEVEGPLFDPKELALEIWQVIRTETRPVRGRS